MHAPNAIPYIRTRLSIQMFLQFLSWGAWAPLLGQHLANLGFAPEQRANVQAMGSLALMIAPLFAGQIADRWFAVQKFLGISFLAAGGLFFVTAGIKDPSQYSLMLLLGLGTMLLFGPTLGLANALCFHNLTDARRDFPAIRVAGTFGWIAAAHVVGWAMADAPPRIEGVPYYSMHMNASLYVAAITLVVNGLYCFTLPNTPPKQEAGAPFPLKKILGMMRDPSFILISTVAFFLLFFASFYYNKLGEFFSKSLGIPDNEIATKASIGQVAEILTMFALPFVYKKLGAKWTIAIGLLAWAVRFAVFASGAPVWVMVWIQSLHGVCFAFAIAAAMIYFERISPPDIRGSVQSFLAVLTYGLGMVAGSYVMGLVAARFTAKVNNAEVVDWQGFWGVPALGCFALLVVFVLGFKARDDEQKAETV